MNKVSSSAAYFLAHFSLSKYSRRDNLSGTGFPFQQLPYDVRAIIYSYVEADTPFTSSDPFLGFILSCRWAKQEIEEFPLYQLDSICTTINDATGVGVSFDYKREYPRNIVVSLPYTAFEESEISSEEQTKWKRAVLVGLHPLFAAHFNIVRLHFSVRQTASSHVPKRETLRDRALLHCMFKQLIHDIGFMIDRVNRDHTYYPARQRREILEARIFNQKPDQPVLSYPSALVRTKRICLSWDLRNTPGNNAMPLNGTLQHSKRVSTGCRYPNPRRPLFKSTRRYIAEAKATLKRTSLASQEAYRRRFEKAVFYSLHNEESSVGEVGIMCPTRWHLEFEAGFFVYLLVDGERDGSRGYHKEGPAWSDGLGKEVRGWYDGDN